MPYPIEELRPIGVVTGTPILDIKPVLSPFDA